MFENWFPECGSLVAKEIDHLFWYATAWTAGTGVLVVGILITFLIIYRARKNRLAFYTHGNTRGALTLTLSLALLVFLLLDINLAYYDHKVWKLMFGHPPASADALKVQVMGEQFAWNIRYAGADQIFGTEDDIVTMNELHVPVNHPVIVQLTSKDVIHSFFLPSLRIKQDAVPGFVTSIYFEPDMAGVFNIACAEHCGLGHYRMKGQFFVEPTLDFETWLAAQPKQAETDTLWAWDWTHGLAPDWKPRKKESEI